MVGFWGAEEAEGKAEEPVSVLTKCRLDPSTCRLTSGFIVARKSLATVKPVLFIVHDA